MNSSAMTRRRPARPWGDDCAHQVLWFARFCGNRDAIVDRKERVDDTRVELAPCCALDLGDRLLDRPRGLVRSIVSERVKYVRHSDHSADKWDGLAGKSVWVSGAVPPFMMAFSDERGHLKHRRAATGE
jgi:hypothetical protein